jgi:hypothetical protein
MRMISTLTPDSDFREWDAFVCESEQGSIFCKSWWLKAVCEDSFIVVVLKRNGKIVAGIPLPHKKTFGGQEIVMPPLTQTLGVLFSKSAKLSYESKLTEEIEMQRELIASIPNFVAFSCKFHYEFKNWLPFYWAGFSQTTYYTYIIPSIADFSTIYKGFSGSKRNHIKNACQKLQVRDSLSWEKLYNLHSSFLLKQGKRIDYSKRLFQRIFDSASQNSACKIWCAVDSSEIVHSAIFVIYDTKSAYYLISAINPEQKSSGANDLLISEALKYLSVRTEVFDFEGSMIPGVEQSFRKLGGVQKPYFHVYFNRRSLPLRIINRGIAEIKNRLS